MGGLEINGALLNNAVDLNAFLISNFHVDESLQKKDLFRNLVSFYSNSVALFCDVVYSQASKLTGVSNIWQNKIGG